MSNKPITITRALVQLKTLTKRINKLTDEFSPVALVVNKKIQSSTESVDEFSKRITEELQTLTDLINLKNKIKSQIVISNAVTKVTIAGEEMTVAQAIERKVSIETDRQLINRMKTQLDEIHRQELSVNRNVESRLDNLLESTFSKDSTKVKKEEFDAVAVPFMERNEATILDPIKIRKEIERREKVIEEFDSDVDVVLTEKNSTTYIN